MNNIKKQLAAMTPLKWVMSVLWAVTFIMLISFVGVISALKPKANQTTSAEYSFARKKGKASNGTETTVKNVDATKDITSTHTAITGFPTDEQSAIAKKVDLSWRAEDFKKHSDWKVRFNKFVDLRKEYQAAQKAKAYFKDQIESKKLKVSTKAGKTPFSELVTLKKDIIITLSDNKKINIGKDSTLKTKTYEDILNEYRSLYLISFAWKNRVKEVTQVEKTINNVVTKVDTTILKLDDKTGKPVTTFVPLTSGGKFYSLDLAKAAALGTDYDVEKTDKTGVATPLASKAADGISITTILFFVSLTSAIFGTAIIKFYENKGGK